MLLPLRRVAHGLLVMCLIPVVAAAEENFQVTALTPDLLLLSTDQGSSATTRWSSPGRTVCCMAELVEDPVK